MKPPKRCKKNWLIRIISLTICITLNTYLLPDCALPALDVGFPPHDQDAGEITPLTPETFTIPEHMATITDSFKGASGRVVVHIQDAHCNYAAQKRIAQIIEYLNKKYDVTMINLEGGEDDYDLTLFTDIAQKSIRAEISDYYVNEGLLNGAEYFAVNRPGAVALWGVEDGGLYMENLAVYRESLASRKDVDKYIASLENALNNIKNKAYSPQLLELDEKHSKYKSDGMEFKEYAGYLIAKAAAFGVDLKGFPNIGLLNKSFEAEEKIDFARANKERDILMDALQKKISRRDARKLVEMALQYKNGMIPPQAFYGRLVGLAASSYVNMAEYPELDKYAAYISFYGAIDRSAVHKEISKFEDALREKLYRDEAERRLGSLLANLELIKKIFALKFTKDDYDHYTAHKADFDSRNFTAFIEKEGPRYRISAAVNKKFDLDSCRSKMERFFELSFKRDEVFLKKMRYSPAQAAGAGPSAVTEAAVIVTGGFHAENICELFRKNGISYISLIPNFVNEPGYECPYFALLGDEAGRFEREIDRAVSAMQIASLLNALGVAANSPRAAEVFRIGVIAFQSMLRHGGGRAFGLKDGRFVVFELKDRRPVCRIVPADADLRGIVVMERDLEISLDGIMKGFSEIGHDWVIKNASVESGSRRYLKEAESPAIRALRRVINSMPPGPAKDRLEKALNFLISRTAEQAGFPGAVGYSAIQLIEGLYEAHAGRQGLYLPLTDANGRQYSAKENMLQLLHELISGTYYDAHAIAIEAEGVLRDCINEDGTVDEAKLGAAAGRLASRLNDAAAPPNNMWEMPDGDWALFLQARDYSSAFGLAGAAPDVAWRRALGVAQFGEAIYSGRFDAMHSYYLEMNPRADPADYRAEIAFWSDRLEEAEGWNDDLIFGVLPSSSDLAERGKIRARRGKIAELYSRIILMREPAMRGGAILLPSKPQQAETNQLITLIDGYVNLLNLRPVVEAGQGELRFSEAAIDPARSLSGTVDSSFDTDTRMPSPVILLGMLDNVNRVGSELKGGDAIFSRMAENMRLEVEGAMEGVAGMLAAEAILAELMSGSLMIEDLREIFASETVNADGSLGLLGLRIYEALAAKAADAGEEGFVEMIGTFNDNLPMYEETKNKVLTILYYRLQRSAAENVGRARAALMTGDTAVAQESINDLSPIRSLLEGLLENGNTPKVRDGQDALDGRVRDFNESLRTAIDDLNNELTRREAIKQELASDTFSKLDAIRQFFIRLVLSRPGEAASSASDLATLAGNAARANDDSDLNEFAARALTPGTTGRMNRDILILRDFQSPDVSPKDVRNYYDVLGLLSVVNDPFLLRLGIENLKVGNAGEVTQFYNALLSLSGISHDLTVEDIKRLPGGKDVLSETGVDLIRGYLKISRIINRHVITSPQTRGEELKLAEHLIKIYVLTRAAQAGYLLANRIKYYSEHAEVSDEEVAGDLKMHRKLRAELNLLNRYLGNLAFYKAETGFIMNILTNLGHFGKALGERDIVDAMALALNNPDLSLENITDYLALFTALTGSDIEKIEAVRQLGVTDEDMEIIKVSIAEDKAARETNRDALSGRGLSPRAVDIILAYYKAGMEAGALEKLVPQPKERLALLRQAIQQVFSLRARRIAGEAQSGMEAYLKDPARNTPEAIKSARADLASLRAAAEKVPGAQAEKVRAILILGEFERSINRVEARGKRLSDIVGVASGLQDRDVGVGLVAYGPRRQALRDGNRAMADRGWGDSSHREQIVTFDTVDSKSIINALWSAAESLRQAYKGRPAYLYACLPIGQLRSENPEAAREIEAAISKIRTETVVPILLQDDAYTDFNSNANQYPDLVSRLVLGRINAAFEIAKANDSADTAGNQAAAKDSALDLLKRVGVQDFLSGADLRPGMPAADFFKLLRATPLRLQALDFKDIQDYIQSFEKVAMSL